MKSIDLNGLRMNAVKTDENGVIDEHTIFDFHQQGHEVFAEYAGGRIVKGYLVGLYQDSWLDFRYCQLEVGKHLSGGTSRCEVTRDDQGLVQIIEYFTWESRPGGGQNIIQELRSD